MRTRAWHFFTILLAALSMGMAFSHVLEMPAKLAYDAALWNRVQHTLYLGYGTVGAMIEVGAVVASIVLAWRTRHERPVSRFTATGAACLLAALVAWLAFVAPMNAIISGWTADAIPADWTRVRAQWEFAHAGRFILQLGGLSSLVMSALARQPAAATAAEPSREFARAA